MKINVKKLSWKGQLAASPFLVVGFLGLLWWMVWMIPVALLAFVFGGRAAFEKDKAKS